MKTKITKTATVLLLAGLMAAGTYAQPGKGMGYGRSGGDAEGYGTGRMALRCQMDLTDAQQEQIQALRLAHYKEIQPLRSKMIELKARERSLMLEDNVDMKALNSVIDEQSDLNNKIRKLRTEHRVKVRSLLTDEQKMIMDRGNSFRHHRRGGNYGYGPCTQGQGPASWKHHPRGWGYSQWGPGSLPEGEDL